MIVIAMRIMLVAIGVMFATAYYADALPYRYPRSPLALRTVRRSLAWAVFWTIVAAVGVVGWAR